MKLKKVISILLALAMILALAACGEKPAEQQPANQPAEQQPANQPTEQQPAPSTPAAPKKEDIIVLVNQEMDSWDPSSSTAMANQYVMNLVYNQLFRQNDLNGTGWEPDLAKSWNWNSDTELQIEIHSGVKFTDGTELTTEDVMYQISRAQVASSAAALMKLVDHCEKIDDYNMKIITKSPYPTLLLALTHMSCHIPAKSYSQACEAAGNWEALPVGSGHYICDERVLGQYVHLVRNDNYWNKDDMAKNKTLTMKLIPEGANRTIMIETGEADLCMQFQTSDYNRVKNEPDKVKLYEGESSTMWYMSMKLNSPDYPWFQDINVRKAINCAVDREAVVLAGYDGLGTPNWSYIANPCLGYKDESHTYPYDIDKAKEYLSKTQWPNGFEVDMYVFSDNAEKVATVVQNCLLDVNIKINLHRAESTVRSQMNSAGLIPCSVGSWGCYLDPDLVCARLLGKDGQIAGSNTNGYTNDEFEVLFAQQKLEKDNNKRAQIFEQIQDIFCEDAPWCPLFVPNSFCLTTKDLQGVVFGQGAYQLWNLHY